jgi:uncharacterized protein with beta-barrel porin domain
MCSPSGDYGGLTVLIDCALGATPAERRPRPRARRASTLRALWAVPAVAAMLLGWASAGRAQENIITNYPARPSFAITDTAANSSANYTLFGLGTNYLQLLGNQGGPTWQAGQFGTGPNPGGGGAPAGPEPPKYRVWTELYGLTANTGAQMFFPGDARKTYGGVAGVAMNVTPSATVGFSVDDSQTRIDITSLPQHATLKLTQVGLNGAYEWGAWTFSGAGVYGFGRVDQSREVFILGPELATYRARLWGVIGEASYYIPLGSARIVPKFGGDWTQTHTDGYNEVGNLLAAVSVPNAMANRGRIFAGAEAGNTFVNGSSVIDVSAYAKVVDILFQRVPDLTVNSVLPTTPVTVFGVQESKYGIDTGAMASMRLSPIARIYAVYDGKFRDGFQSHSGTLGLEFRW